jgi:alcohol dehydrogenase class IV
MRQTVYFGRGAAARVGAILDRHEAKRVFLVCGGHSFEQSGAAAALAPALRTREVREFREFRQNPQLEDIEAGVARLTAGAFDVVLAVGGGSALDIAKLVNTIAAQRASAESVVTGATTAAAPGLPFVAVPTTAGSGSEATHFAVAYVGHTKYSVAHPNLLPTYAVIDPALTESLPPDITAVTGIDAFCQAVESYWSVHASAASRNLARRALRHAWQHLQTAVTTPTPDARRGMCKASYLAGAAINMTKTTAAHALSYPLTSRFGIPHGQAVCLTLGHLLLYNSEAGPEDTVDPQGPAHVRRVVAELVELMDSKTPAECRDRIAGFIRSVGLRTRFSEFGLPCADTIDWVAGHANVERMTNNPRALGDGSVRRLLAEVC